MVATNPCPQLGERSALGEPAVVGVDSNGRICRWDGRAEEIYGVDARLMIGRPAAHLAPPRDTAARQWLRRATRAVGDTTDVPAAFETHAVRPDHTSAPVLLEAGTLHRRHSSSRTLIVVRQIGEHAPDAAAELHALRGWVKSVQTALATARTLALVIDEDEVISSVANPARMPSGWEPARLVGRSPIDFVHPDDRGRAIATLRKVMSEPGEHPRLVVKALNPRGEPIWLESMLTNALDDPDVRGVIGSFCDVTEQVRRDADVDTGRLAAQLDDARLRSRLQRGLREIDYDRDLRLAYQPIVDMTDARPVTVEALLRWRHPKLGEIPPDVFIPIAEASGAIAEIGRWVLRQACRDAVDGATVSPSASVNVSSRQLSRASFADDVMQALEQSGLPADRLILEVTETAVLEDTTTAVDALGRLSALGVRVAIDDFGTGYATLTHLKRLPVDIVKIDRSFVAGLGHDDGDAAIVRSVIQLAHALRTEVIAEGVETVEQRDLLLAMGCAQGQGWLFGRPVEVRGRR